MFKDTEAMTNLYQMVVLGAVVGLNLLVFLKTGELNNILVGGLLGTLVGIPVVNKK